MMVLERRRTRTCMAKPKVVRHHTMVCLANMPYPTPMTRRRGCCSSCSIVYVAWYCDGMKLLSCHDLNAWALLLRVRGIKASLTSSSSSSLTHGFRCRDQKLEDGHQMASFQNARCSKRMTSGWRLSSETAVFPRECAVFGAPEGGRCQCHERTSCTEFQTLGSIIGAYNISPRGCPNSLRNSTLFRSLELPR